ncbi:hypothetical protein L873DRAFT_1680385, partial [Choiromyces venosus 120613-1]
FLHSLDKIMRVFHQVLDALLLLYPECVRPPTDTVPKRITQDWDKMQYFKDIREAIDGIDIDAHIPVESQVPFHN